MSLYDMNDVANRLFVKQSRQAERQKTVTAYTAAAAKDASILKDAGDGEMIKMQNPDGIKEFETGGPSARNLLMSQQLDGQINRFGGNLDTLGGLSASADTLGQEEIMMAQSAKRTDQMADETYRFAQEVVSTVAQLDYSDPYSTHPLTLTGPSGEASLQYEYSAQDRLEDFTRFAVNIIPLSMQRPTAANRRAGVKDLIQSILIPLAPLMEQQGLVPNYEEVVSLWASVNNVSDMVPKLLIHLNGANTDAASPADRPGQPPQSVRVYDHKSSGGDKRNSAQSGLVAAARAEGTEDA